MKDIYKQQDLKMLTQINQHPTATITGNSDKRAKQRKKIGRTEQ